MIKRIIITFLVLLAITVFPFSVMALENNEMGNESKCHLVENEYGELVLVCDEEDTGVMPCYIPCSIDCWDDE